MSDVTNRKRVGFIGLGKMGYAMTRNLLAAGFPVTVYDVVPEAVERLIPFEASPAGSPRQVGERSDVAITMVPADLDVEQAVLGPDGLLAGLRPGTIMLQMSTIKPSTIHKLAPHFAARGVRLLDAPVSMGHYVAEGKLSIYVGGDPADLDEVRDVLKPLGPDVMHVGPLGSGQACKLVNNYVSIVNATVAAEGLLMGIKAGIDPQVLYQVVLKGSGSSVCWRDKVPMMIDHDFDPPMTFTTDLAYKDVSLAVESAQELQTPAMFGAIARDLYNATRRAGRGRLHYASVSTVLESLAGFQVPGRPDEAAE